MTNPKIFLSHIHSEKEIAEILKKAIKDEFRRVDIFVSSNSDSNPAGQKWFDNIQTNFKGCVAGVFLISKESVARPWINFELGALWMKSLVDDGNKFPLLPILHSGIKNSDLSIPMNLLGCVDASDPDSMKNLFKSLALALKDTAHLNTNFHSLVELIKLKSDVVYKAKYIYDLLRLIFGDCAEGAEKIVKIISDCKPVKVGPDKIPQQVFLQAKELEKKIGKYVQISAHSSGIGFGEYGTSNFVECEVNIQQKLFVENRSALLELIQTA